MISTPSVSVIICTQNRAASLSETLRTLGALEVPFRTRAEIVVVDNASADGTRAVVSDAAGASPIPVRYVHEPRSGLSAARNRAIGAAKGSLLLFTDDDCLPAPTWMAAMVRAIGGDLRQVLGGRVELHDARDAPITIKTSPAGQTLASHGALFGFLHGCNMAVGRRVFDEIGRFDELLGAGTSLAAAEDADLAYRAFRAGVKVSYDPGPVVFHNHGRRTRAEVAGLLRGYKIGAGAVAMKHLLGGDPGPAKNCYWDFRETASNWTKGKAGLSHLVTEGHAIRGAFEFAVRAGLRGFVRGNIVAREGTARPVLSAPDRR